MSRGIKTKMSIMAVLTLTFVTLGFGCKGLSEEQQQAIQPVRLNYWTVYNDTAALRQLADAYKQVRPYVTVNIKKVRYDEFGDLFVNALADDVAPDVVSLHARWLREYAPRLSAMPSQVQVANVRQEGSIQPKTVVTQEMVRLPSQRGISNAYVRTVPEDVIINGSVYGLPLAMDTMALYYNKKLLDEAGIAQPPQTWAEFLDAVEQTSRVTDAGRILQSGVALGTGHNIDHAPDIFALLTLQNGVNIAGSGVRLAAQIEGDSINEHPTIQALRFYTDFARPTKQAYSWNTEQENAFRAFTRGKSVFYFGFAFDKSRIEAAAPQMELEVIPIPQLNPEQPENVANYWVESVVDKSSNKAVAWDFVRFIASPDNVAKYTEQTQLPTPLRSQIESQSEDPFLSVFSDDLLTAKNWYRGRDDAVAREALRDLIDQYLEPTEGDNPAERNIQLINNAARIIQQTM